MTLYVVDPDDERDAFPPPSAMTLGAFLQDRPPWTPRLDRTVLMFDMLPLIFNDDINSFGYLSHIVLQLEEVSARLTAGKYALLCTSGGEPLFLILEPAEGGTEVSILGTHRPARSLSADYAAARRPWLHRRRASRAGGSRPAAVCKSGFFVAASEASTCVGTSLGSAIAPTCSVRDFDAGIPGLIAHARPPAQAGPRAEATSDRSASCRVGQLSVLIRM
ncbi:hypothetical protein [Nannocystis punicea]|uniref:Uncharacterized protein n=1 Tax=Nannocystis punicea TaxID=2995304 RepID=A0ABY7GVK6_9BACT|nr:hypothetical protein [Nannocystis poenicansa]WAS90987.1 hypothetical protein O0S08_32765 [Nannocystis poenicansa]